MPIGAVRSEEARRARASPVDAATVCCAMIWLSQPERYPSGFWSTVLTRTYPIHCPCIGHSPKAMVSGCYL
jgi:hypothetical protein